MATLLKPNLSIVMVGDCDSGKSTLVGRLALETGALSQPEQETLKQRSSEIGKESFWLAFYSDVTKKERECCVTRDIHYSCVGTDQYNYTIIDVPGHRTFINNTVTGITQSDVAILVISAVEKGNRYTFESSISKGNHQKCEAEGNTRIHAKLAHSHGVKQIIVVINKMDHESVRWDRYRFKSIKEKLEKILTKIGYKSKRIPFIPISAYAWNGDNIVNKSQNMSWYKGFSVEIKKKTVTGYTLLDALNNVVTKPKRYNDKPFRMPISWIPYSDKIVIGKIMQGTIKTGQMITFSPSEHDIKAKITSIKVNNQQVDVGYAGDIVGVKFDILGMNGHEKDKSNDTKPNILGFSTSRNVKKKRIKRGQIMIHEDDVCPPSICRKFVAVISLQKFDGRLFESKGKSIWKLRKKQGINAGKLKWCSVKRENGSILYGYCMSAHVPMEIKWIKWIKSKSTNDMKIDRARQYVKNLDMAEIVFEPKRPIIMISFDTSHVFGRVTFRDHFGSICSLVMIGKVLSVLDDGYFEKLMHGFLRSALIELDTEYIVTDIHRLMLVYINFDIDHWSH